MTEGKVGCMKELGITESFSVKRQVLVQASEAAEMILRCSWRDVRAENIISVHSWLSLLIPFPSGLMIFWRPPQGRENKTEATAKTLLEWLSCTFSSTFFHEGSPRGTKSDSGPLESSNPSESSDLLILTCTNATARVLNNASIFINETRALKPWNVFTTVMWSLCLSDDLLNLKYMHQHFNGTADWLNLQNCDKQPGWGLWLIEQAN